MMSRRSTAKWARLWFPLATVLAVSLAVPSAHALVSGVRDGACANGEGYWDYYGGTLTGDPQNPFAPCRVVIPKPGAKGGWNGRLLAYARGTGSTIKVGQDGKPLAVDGTPLVDPTTQSPLLGFTPLSNGLPEITGAGLVLSGNAEALEEQLVCERKYAAVASDYKPDVDFLANGKLGWAVEDGVRDIGLAILQARRLLLTKQGHWPQRTILMARSQGSLIALRYAEERSPLIDGVVSVCTVGAGASRSWDSAVDVALAIDVAFGGAGGTGGWPWGDPDGNLGKVKPGVVFATDVVATVEAWFPPNDPQTGGESFARLEFVRLVTGLPLEGFYPFPVPNPATGGMAPGYPDFNWLASALLFSTEVKADIEGRAGGAVGQNKDHAYHLTKEQRRYLKQIGLPSEVIDNWLLAMNARRNVEGSEAGRTYTARYRDPTFAASALPHPILSVHTTTDGLVLPSQETELRDTLEDKKGVGVVHQKQLLRQTFVDSNGHCTLTEAEVAVAIAAMEKRLNDGYWPGAGFFPNNPASKLRFRNGFNPGQYPQPGKHKSQP